MKCHVVFLNYFYFIFFLVERDPRKRRVKPVSKHLLQLDFGGLDSSDDSDFEVAEHQGRKHYGWHFILTPYVLNFSQWT